MDTIKKAIEGCKETLTNELDINSLRIRNPIAHKWKVTYQSLCIRETVAWRFVDIVEQSWHLHQNNYALGARILLRSVIETLAILIYHNQLTRKVVSNNITFLDYMQKTATLLSGSRDRTTDTQATNILTVLTKCEQKYEGIEKLYGWLSESAHPNYEGMRISYSETNPETMITYFKNKTNEFYSQQHQDGISMSLFMFEHEYNDEWEQAFLALEDWLVQNDSELDSKYGTKTNSQ